MSHSLSIRLVQVPPPAISPINLLQYHCLHLFFHHRQLHLVTLDQTPAKCILFVQCAALPWMVQAKLVSPVELYVTYSLTFFFGFLCHVHLTEAAGCDEGGKRGSIFFNFKGEDEPNACKKNLCTLRSHFFYLSSSFSILARVVPGSCTVYGALQSKMVFTSSVLRLNLLPAILSCWTLF